MKLLFVKGDRGLVANLLGKFYFPDKKSKITEEGLYDCKVTIDKENYAFVEGELVETAMPISFMNELLNDYLFEDNSLIRINNYFVKQVGKSIIVFITREHTSNTIGYVDFNGCYENVLHYQSGGRRRSSVEKLYEARTFDDIDGYTDLQRESLRAVSSKLSSDKLMKVLSLIISKEHIGSYEWENLNSINLYEEKFIVIKTTHFGSDSKSIYCYNDEKGLTKLTMLEEKDFNTKPVQINIKDVSDFMVNNYIGLPSLSSRFTDGVLAEKDINFMGNTLSVKYIDGSHAIDEISEEDKASVEKSFEELAAFRKRVGKSISKKMLKEFVKLSPRNVLGINF